MVLLRRSTSIFVFFSLAACSSSGSHVSDPCRGIACEAGEACIDGACAVVCETFSDCPTEQDCIDGVCTEYRCGNGKIEGLEECDDGEYNNDLGECTLACQEHACGDGHIYACDDGNLDDGDGCDSNCTATGYGCVLVHTTVCVHAIRDSRCTSTFALAKNFGWVSSPLSAFQAFLQIEKDWT